MTAKLSRWWRRWSPWTLRRHLDAIQSDLNRYTTAGEQDWRYVDAVLDGHPDPAGYALRFSVKGTTLTVKQGPAW